jgi:protein-S-isoprenylcysteine O-methyltransferase Ste14
MPRLALGLYLSFVALAFGWRTWRQLRTTGSSGFVGLSRGSALERVGGLLLVLALALGLAAPLVELASWAEPWFRARPLLGCTLYGLGLALTLWAQLAMGASWRIGVDPAERTALVTAGPFRLARNPIYTGMLAVALGLALLVPNAWAFASVLALAAGLELHVRAVEEPYLIAQHGEAYLGWARRVGRFVPGVGRLR